MKLCTVLKERIDGGIGSEGQVVGYYTVDDERADSSWIAAKIVLRHASTIGDTVDIQVAVAEGLANGFEILDGDAGGKKPWIAG